MSNIIVHVTVIAEIGAVIISANAGIRIRIRIRIRSLFPLIWIFMVAVVLY